MTPKSVQYHTDEHKKSVETTEVSANRVLDDSGLKNSEVLRPKTLSRYKFVTSLNERPKTVLRAKFALNRKFDFETGNLSAGITDQNFNIY